MKKKKKFIPNNKDIQGNIHPTENNGKNTSIEDTKMNLISKNILKKGDERDGDYKKEGVAGTGTCLEILTKETNTVIEIYSEECGCGFQEHIIIDNGEIKLHECVDYAEHWIDPDEFESIEDYNKKYNTDFTEDMIEDEYVRVGGFANWDFTI